MWFRSLGGEDPLEEEMASHSSVLAWRISQTEEPGWLQSMGFQRVGYDWAYTHTIHNLFNSLSRERGKFSVSVLSVLAQKSQKWSVFFSRRLSFPLLFSYINHKLMVLKKCSRSSVHLVKINLPLLVNTASWDANHSLQIPWKTFFFTFNVYFSVVL